MTAKGNLPTYLALKWPTRLAISDRHENVSPSGRTWPPSPVTVPRAFDNILGRGRIPKRKEVAMKFGRIFCLLGSLGGIVGCAGTADPPPSGTASGEQTAMLETASTSACATKCSVGLSCCGDRCANLQNDILNCGACGKVCGGPDPFCDNGHCMQAPCTTTPTCGGLCCGDAICRPGQLCCNVPGPGPARLGPSCTNAVNGTCPVGCPACL